MMSLQLGSSRVQNSAGEDCLSSDYDDQEDSGQVGVCVGMQVGLGVDR